MTESQVSEQQLERMKQLIAEINYHNKLYYTMDQPELTDKQYDVIYDQLIALEKATGVTLPFSPSLRVGDTLLKGFDSYKHRAKLWSLDKAQNKADLLTWHIRAI
jgi:DNA ligase (NAD+)